MQRVRITASCAHGKLIQVVVLLLAEVQARRFRALSWLSVELVALPLDSEATPQSVKHAVGAASQNQLLRTTTYPAYGAAYFDGEHRAILGHSCVPLIVPPLPERRCRNP